MIRRTPAPEIERKMSIIYDLVFLIIGIAYLPVYVFRRKLHRGFLARLGFLPKGLSLGRPIWIHAVSVGEAMAIRGLLEGLRTIYPEKKFVISTVTSTGNAIAKAASKEGDFVTYLPLDFSLVARGVIKRLNPSAFIIAETEIWPNLIACLYKKKIPVIIVNGRISDKSFRGYLSIKFLLRPTLTKINLFCVQTKRDAQRLVRLGVNEDKINITGNMKFDSALSKMDSFQLDGLRRNLGLRPSDKLWVCGSTHPGEEDMVLYAYKELQREFPDLKLLLAPRHPERSADIAKIVSSFGFRSEFISRQPSKCSTCLTQPVFILDTIGKLIYFYGIAEIVFVGGSLIEKGGHNILEPAFLAKPVLFGPYMFNFRDIADLFLKNEAAVLINSKEELQEKIKKFLQNPQDALQLGQRARDLILRNSGATKKSLELIKNNLRGHRE